MTKVCFYHKDCPDGFGSATVVWTYFGDECLFFPMAYGDEIPYEKLTKDVDVYIVDYSFPVDEMMNISEKCNKVVLLDHHKTAKERLGEVKFPENVEIILDMNRSGVGITWDYFFPDFKMPFLLKCVQDRDLWKWELLNSEYVLYRLDLEPYNFTVWNQLISDTSRSPEFLDKMIEDGKLIAKYRDVLYNEILEDVEYYDFFSHGVEIPVVQCPRSLTSNIGNILSVNNLFALMWQRKYNGYNFSLRSKEFDVSMIAKYFGGGGHRNAAGFFVKDHKNHIRSTIQNILDMSQKWS